MSAGLSGQVWVDVINLGRLRQGKTDLQERCAENQLMNNRWSLTLSGSLPRQDDYVGLLRLVFNILICLSWSLSPAQRACQALSQLL